MKLFAVIPVKPLADGKSRLADVLTDQARRDLNQRMFTHVLDTAAAVIGAASIVVVSADGAVLDLAAARGAHALREETQAGLNPALKAGAAAASAHGADAILVLPTDLPTLSPGDIEALTHRASDSPCLLIAPDRQQKGTNSLLISPPDAVEFSFGPDSFAKHQRAARAIGVAPVIVRRDGLAFDIDTPEDYRLLVKQGG